MFTRKGVIIITRSIVITRKVSSSLVTYLEEEEAFDFTFFFLSFAMRHVCLGRFGKSDLLDEAFPLITMVATSSLFGSELSSLEFHS
jgi:hypothetical protein